MTELDDKADGARARLHRLYMISGAVLLGFVFLHVVTQASALGGAAAYERLASVARSPAALVLEMLVLVSLGLHVTSGLRLLATPRARASEGAPCGDRPLRRMRAASAVVALIFVIAHASELRIARLAFGLSHDALYSTITAHLSSTWGGFPWIALAYLVGIGATALYFANGLHAAVATRYAPAAAPRRLRIATSALGALLFVIGAATVIALATGGRLLGSADDDALPCGSAVSSGASSPPPSK